LTLVDQVEVYKSLYSWSVPTIIISTSISAMIEQGFLIHRFHYLSKNHFISFVLAFLVVVHVVFYFIAGIFVGLHPDLRFNHRHSLGTVAATIATALSAVIDVSIALALVIQLRKMKTAFRSTNGLIRRVSINSIASGCAVSIFGVILPILFQLRANVILVFAMTLGRFYSITVLVNLVMLKRTLEHTSVIHTDGDFERSVVLSDSLHVHRSAVIRVNSDLSGKPSLFVETPVPTSTSKPDYPPKQSTSSSCQ